MCTWNGAKMLSSPKVMIQWAGSMMAIAGIAFGQVPGSFEQVGDTKVSAMMMFLGNEQKVYILDKTEGNPSQINGHPAWGVEWDIASSTATLMDVPTNTFCAAGMHFPNGSWATFGGNAAVGPGGNIGSMPNPGGADALYDATYQDWDGRRAIRILNPCSGGSTGTAQCQWFDNTTYIGMQKARWYASTEALNDGSVVIVGGYTNGGYINRNTPNIDPAYSGGAAEPTFEFWPSRGTPAAVMQFMITTSGLNSYAHLYLMPSGKMFAQANFSTILWDYNNNIETPLPDMPGRVIRVYPASGAVAMLPLTPGNNYTPTILFCGGSDMPEPAWGNYSWPSIDTWNYPASQDCQRITPEPTDGSQPVYIQDDQMLEGRTMGQFIILPDSTLLVLNGALNGTAGYSTQTGETPTYGQMPFGMSLAAGPVLTPAIYNPNAPPGQRWQRFGQPSSIPRLYHSTAVLLPDGSVLVAGSNPNVDVNLTTAFPTTYTAERFYPPYFANISSRPVPEGLPDTLSYGGAAFQVYLPVGAFVGDPNEAAGSARVVLVRPGFSTHAMNMGQRLLQLDSTFEVSDEGNVVLHVAQVPPNPNLLTPGPVLMFVIVGGIPSVGKMVTVGTGQIGTQPVQDASFLPPSRARPSPSPSAAAANTDADRRKAAETRTRKIAIAVSVAGGVLITGLIVAICLIRRRKDKSSVPDDVATRAPARPVSISSAPLWRPGAESQSGAWTPSVNGSNPQLLPRTRAYESDSSASLGGPVVSPARTYYSGR
ncbi:glyoxal oxidase [Rhizoctonia solani 123E]|uniref:Glyoxal oxidase n=1 Tax=Rhizoctonia solani 123E TaxID=1423351 RepID=A0A074S7C0_9AGAM|nr:glyoxal oxidase [Rhizoctonia solani 123E]